MNGWVVLGIIAGTIATLATITYLTLAAYAATQLAHIARGELEIEDESEDD